MENKSGGGTYYFSSAQDPQTGTARYTTASDFTSVMMNHTAPTLLVVGGKYVKTHGMDVENVTPVAFPWGIGGPNTRQQTAVSIDVCIQRYFRTAMSQLVRGGIIRNTSHIYQNNLVFKSRVIISRGNKINGVPPVECLAKMTFDDSKRFQARCIIPKF